jgi:hypothetical protein
VWPRFDRAAAKLRQVVFSGRDSIPIPELLGKGARIANQQARVDIVDLRELDEGG